EPDWARAPGAQSDTRQGKAYEQVPRDRAAPSALGWMSRSTAAVWRRPGANVSPAAVTEGKTWQGIESPRGLVRRMPESAMLNRGCILPCSERPFVQVGTTMRLLCGA